MSVDSGDNAHTAIHNHQQGKADLFEISRQDNKNRLKQVRNLEDLINFKVSTVQKPANLV